MTGCDDTGWIVNVVVNNYYRITASSEEEAISKGTKAWLDGEIAPSVFPRGTEVEAMGKSREELIDKAIAALEANERVWWIHLRDQHLLSDA